MNKLNLLIFGLLVVIAILAFTIFIQEDPTLEQPMTTEEKTAPIKPEKKPIIHYPVPKVEKEYAEEIKVEVPKQETKPEPKLPEKLPPVELSDESVHNALLNLKLSKNLSSLILREGFIQKFVTTVDNLPGKKITRTHLPIAPPTGRFIVSGTVEDPQTSTRNFVRYTDHVKLLEQLDEEIVLKIYVYFYPLFQKAYRQLGYKNAYFNDRLVTVIDHLLETPNPPEPIPLKQPSVLYTYADPLLEDLSVGQKTIIRFGPDWRVRTLKVLSNYREKLISLKP